MISFRETEIFGGSNRFSLLVYSLQYSKRIRGGGSNLRSLEINELNGWKYSTQKTETRRADFKGM